MKEGYFTPEFLANLPPNYLEGLVQICDECNRFQTSLGQPAHEQHNEDYIEIIALLKAYFNHHKSKQSIPDIDPNREKNTISIYSFLRQLGVNSRQELSKSNGDTLLKSKTEEYSSLFSGLTAYEFADEDYKRIQILMNELRDLIVNSKLITADHQRRLLRRLEAMQRELHKRTSDIDRFWGFIGEAGITIRKFGEDVKPIADRVGELGRIVIGVIMAKEGIKALPEISNLLK